MEYTDKKAKVWECLRKCLLGEHCTCEVEICCWCESRDLRNPEELALVLVAPYNASEDEIKAFLEYSKANGECRSG
jgi:hypothetical protein